MLKSEAKIGMKVHPIGRGDSMLYIVELGDKVAGVSADKNATIGIGILYERLVKFKNQSQRSAACCQCGIKKQNLST